MTRTPQAHPEVTLRTRSKPVPDSASATSELSRYTTVTCLVCGVPAYRVAQRITPDLASEEGPLLPTEDWVEKELCKSSSGWIEAFQGCLVSLVPCDPHSPGVCGASATSPMRRYASPSALAPLSASHDAIDVCVCVQTEDEIAQAELSTMYSKLLSVVLPGGTPPAAAASDHQIPDRVNARGPSEDGKSHLPELPPLFLPPPFTPSHVVFSHFARLASDHAQTLRDDAEEYIARLTEQKVAELMEAEAVLKKEVDLVWSRFRDSVRLHADAGTSGKGAMPMRRRSSVSGHGRSASQPVQAISASVRVSSFVPTPTHSTRTSPTRAPVPSALSASLKTTSFHHPDALRPYNGNGSTSSPRSSEGSISPPRSSPTRVQSPSTASTRTAAMTIDAETSIREAYRREMNETKDTATSYRYFMDLEHEMEQQRQQAAAEAEIASPPVASGSQAAPEDNKNPAGGAGRSPRVHKSAIKHAGGERSKSPKGKSKDDGAADEPKDGNGKGKRKVTFDVQPEVTVIKDEGEFFAGQAAPQEVNEGERGTAFRAVPWADM